jgi:hypothetical protein
VHYAVWIRRRATTYDCTAPGCCFLIPFSFWNCKALLRGSSDTACRYYCCWNPFFFPWRRGESTLVHTAACMPRGSSDISMTIRYTHRGGTGRKCALYFRYPKRVPHTDQTTRQAASAKGYACVGSRPSKVVGTDSTPILDGFLCNGGDSLSQLPRTSTSLRAYIPGENREHRKLAQFAHVK